MSAIADKDKRWPGGTILADRWQAMMEDGLEITDLQQRLDDLLYDLADGLSRQPDRWEDAAPVVEELEATIRERLIAWAERDATAMPARLWEADDRRRLRGPLTPTEPQGAA